MAEKTVSQVQQSAEGWKKLWEEHLGRMAAAQEQTARLEQQWMDNLQAAVDQTATLTKQALSYSAQLSSEWRKLSLDAARKTTDLFTAKA